MPDEKRIIELKGWFNDDCTFTPYKRAEIIYRVILLMKFPNGPDIREKFFTQFAAGENAFETMQADPKFIKLDKQGQRNCDKAIVAGSILDDIFKAWKWNPEAGFGVNKAIEVLVKYSEYHPRFETKIIDGQRKKNPLPPKRKLSERTALKYWKEYRCVAHLFTALLHHETVEGHKKTVAKRRPNFDLLKPENFLYFMWLAKQRQDFAVNHTPARAREPLIPRDEIWWIEPDFELPSLGIRHPQQIPRWVQGAFRK